MSEVVCQAQTGVPTLLAMPFAQPFQFGFVLCAAFALVLTCMEVRRRRQERFLTAIAIYQHRHHDGHRSLTDRPEEGEPPALRR